MKTSTKNKQSQETISNMVKRAFKGVEALEVIELKEGFFNVAYMVILSDGRQVVLKIAPPKDALIMTHEKNIMQTEVEVMRLIKNKTDIPIAEVLYYDNSHELCETDYFFMSRLDGESLNSVQEKLSEEKIRNVRYKTAVLNLKINSITGNKFGYYGQLDKQGVKWTHVFYDMIKDTINDAKALNIDIGVESEVIEQLFLRDIKAFEEVKVPKLVHWDLWAGNIFIDDGQITGLIDFERCLWGDELMEVGFRTHNQNREFFSGYGIETLTNNQKLRIRWYDLYLFLIQVLECDYRNYEDYGCYDWAKENICKIVQLLKENNNMN
ncbi:aminoglycoside 3'-phosphotransferase/choline kinase family protein [Clostridium sp. YIM B02505]|uniref:Aminoglycoside 3'-phosphotransferase/choline kinase family protein n=1 Tax=Clostridium yunnanense TaxID=2800325 RepID=A0ABS1EKB9_9CLOT|nr:aminoglycoside 3'-phosphotransferase/choline kinase family protein [Clostridium yunnanense]MBK1809809.1 aminoglycoside 3'-phosphotransferase/choline kinase family protein [Clostridium yunnanense]